MQSIKARILCKNWYNGSIYSYGSLVHKPGSVAHGTPMTKKQAAEALDIEEELVKNYVAWAPCAVLIDYQLFISLVEENQTRHAPIFYNVNYNKQITYICS